MDIYKEMGMRISRTMGVQKSIDFYIQDGLMIQSNAHNKAKYATGNSVFSPSPAYAGELYKRYRQWNSEVKRFVEDDLNGHPRQKELLDSINADDKNGREIDAVLTCIIDKLRSIETNDIIQGDISQGKHEKIVSTNSIKEVVMNKDIFIVHGHDERAILKAENFVRKMELNPIILQAKPSKGMTIIEKIEAYTGVGFAIVLYTPCDKIEDGKFRARQNVVLEHGYCIGKLGRERVAALVMGDVETPGDISGVVYIPMDDGKQWEYRVAQELKAVGYDVDMSKI